MYFKYDENINIFLSLLVIEELKRNKCVFFCICYGARSSPFITAISKMNGIKIVICYDERSAGFLSLGYRKSTGKTCAIIVTSGTALINLLPSVVEAKQVKESLILITGDRPTETIDTGANQTIEQTNILKDYIDKSINISVDYEVLDISFLLGIIDYSLFITSYPLNGRVHLNFRFRDPLYLEKKCFKKIENKYFSLWLNSKKEYTYYIQRRFKEKKINIFIFIIKLTKYGFFIIGSLSKLNNKKNILQFIRNVSWMSLFDITAGLNINRSNNLFYYDYLIILLNKSSQKYETVIHIGNRIVSKNLQTYLDKININNYLMIDIFLERVDPSLLVNYRIINKIKSYLNFFYKINNLSIKIRYINYIYLIENIVKKTIDSSYEISSSFISRELTRVLTKNTALFIGNSLPIRDMNLFGKTKINKSFIYSNRGASGIDGLLSTAVGVGMNKFKYIVIYLGDLSLLYDVNALFLLKNIFGCFIIVLSNNNGGGIFSYLALAKSSNLNRPYYSAVHNIKIKYISKAFGIRYREIKTKHQFLKYVIKIEQNKTNLILDVFTNKRCSIDLRDTISRNILSIVDKQ